MSLRIFIKMPDVASKLKGLRPKFPRKIPVPLQVEPRSDRFPLVGMGFDYLLRMELQRRAPHAVSDRWTAESAPGLIWQRNDKGARWMPLSKDQNGRVYMADILGNEDDAREVAERAREVVDKAKAALAAYTKNTSPMPGEQADLAAHAIRLAKLDPLEALPKPPETLGKEARSGVLAEPLSRARVFDATFDEAAQED